MGNGAIKYLDRATGEIVTESVMGDGALRFAYNTLLESIVVQGNISQLLDGSFVGCSNLQQIVLQQTNPSKISVGWNLLDNTNATILVPQDCVANYANDYFWGHYSGRIRGY